jgi:hypothetical protein
VDSVISTYGIFLNSSGISVDPITFRKAVFMVEGSRLPTTYWLYGGAPFITSDSAFLVQGQKGTRLQACATYDCETNVLTEKCISIAVQFVSLTGKNFIVPLVNGEQLCTYGITTTFLEAKPNQKALDGGSSPSVPVVLHAAPAGSCN